MPILLILCESTLTRFDCQVIADLPSISKPSACPLQLTQQLSSTFYEIIQSSPTIFLIMYGPTDARSLDRDTSSEPEEYRATPRSDTPPTAKFARFVDLPKEFQGLVWNWGSNTRTTNSICTMA